MIIDLPDTTVATLIEALTAAQAKAKAQAKAREKRARIKESTAVAQRAADADDVVRSIRSLDSSGAGVEPTIIARGSIIPRERIWRGLAEAQRLGDVVAVRNPVTGAASWRLTPTALARVEAK